MCNLPTVPECCSFNRDLKLASLGISVYCMLVGIIFYGAIYFAYGCRGISTAIDIASIVVRIIYSLLLIIGSVILLIGVLYDNDTFILYFVILAFICFTIETLFNLYHMYFVIMNLEECKGFGFINACAGLMMPVMLLYFIIVVNSYRHEIMCMGQPA